jgi:hypothetical protein
MMLKHNIRQAANLSAKAAYSPKPELYMQTANLAQAVA